jgi:hydroxyacylglutathione hydrolase
MLKVHSFTFNPFQENTYLIVNEQSQCWIIDPGMFNEVETETITGFIAQNGLSPQAIVNTHTHIDHILGVQALKDRYHIPFLMHDKDLPVLQGAVTSAMMFGLPLSAAPQPDGFIREGVSIQMGDESVEVLFTPGHSPGSVSFYYPSGNWVIGGDVLFYGSIGRTDLPGGNFDTLINSIRTQLLTLPGNTKVYSGHGPATSIGEEQQNNPFLQ